MAFLMSSPANAFVAPRRAAPIRRSRAGVCVRAMSQNIVDTAVGAGSFNTLAAALGAAGLVETLSDPGPFTVFAPTDAAFDRLPSGTVESLLRPENREQLVGILTYHCAAGKTPSKRLENFPKIKTLQGESLAIATKVETKGGITTGVAGGVTLGPANEWGKPPPETAATVIQADIDCSNGIIHVIDTVLIPPLPVVGINGGYTRADGSPL